jgi:hypothetical protein
MKNSSNKIKFFGLVYKVELKVKKMGGYEGVLRM